jgi:GxxExxY protein
MATSSVDDKYAFSQLSSDIIGCAYRVHRTLGPGFPESVYKRAMTYELMKAKIAFQTEAVFEVTYDGKPCGEFRADLFVDAKIIVELKAIEQLCKENQAQTLSYLKASKVKVGLLMNFGEASLKVKRFVN